jgi:hypothetical protein
MNTHRLACVALALLMLPACLVTSGSKKESTGTHVSAETLGQITEGESESFVVELLGEPSRRIQKADGAVLLAWDWERTVSRKGAVLLVFAGGNEDTQRATTWVRLDGDQVTRVWQDNAEQ